MKYPVHAYADAFLSLIEEHPEKKGEIVKGFARTLRSSGDAENADKIIACVEEKMARKEGRAKIKIYSARILPDALIQKIKNTFGKDSLVSHVIAPEIIAGVKIVVNDEIMIDATLKKKLELITK
jgi:F0F1-type ATP synthase delta subunit